MNVFQSLNEARAKFHELKLEKTGHNKFAGYKYFELGDFVIPALKVFRECGLCAVVSFDKDTAVMEIRSVTDPDHVIRITSPMGSAALKGCHEVQNIGAVETYQRRYLWTAALEIVEHDALDATTGKEAGKQVKPKGAVEPPKTGAMADVLAELPPLAPEWVEYFTLLAEEVTELFDKKGPTEAKMRVAYEELDNEQRIQLEARLPSHVRSGLKK